MSKLSREAKALQKEAEFLTGHAEDIALAADRLRMFAKRVADIPAALWDGEVAEIAPLIKRIRGSTMSLEASAKFTQCRYRDLKEKA